MQVYLKLFSTIQKNPAQQKTVRVEPGSSVSDLMKQEKINPDDVCVLVINKQDATFDTRLKDNDLITIIPPIAGG